jgi:large subunit ribosomal protein L25
MTEELTVDVPVVPVGESLAVSQHGGTLAWGTDSVRVKALPDRLPQSFEISIEPLVDFDAVLHVRDLSIPSGVTLLTDPDEALVHVLAPRIEEEEIAPVAAEVEGEAAATGEAAAAVATEREGEAAEA